MGNILEHAKREMRLAGLYDRGADYAGAIPGCVEALVEVIEGQGHSGASQGLVLSLFIKLASFQTLTSLTNNPDEWMEVAHGVWQNRRNPACFSRDGGKTYYDLDDKDRKTIVSAPSK